MPMQEYKAFISYSHAADQRLAPRLQAALRRFAVPFYRWRGRAVFRDETGLGMTEELWPRIQEALDASEHFLLLASPDAAKSPWVQRELDHWLSAHKNRPLIVWTAGRLEWTDADSDGQSDFDWEKTTALPRQLERVYAEEPMVADLRFANKKPYPTTRDPRLRTCVARLTSTIEDVPLEQIVGLDVNQKKRFVWITSIVAAALLCLAMLAGWQWYEAARANVQLSTRLEQLSVTMHLRVAPAAPPGYDIDPAWYGVATENTQSVVLIADKSREDQGIVGSGFIVRASALNEAWGDEHVLVTASHVLGETADYINQRPVSPENARITVPGLLLKRELEVDRIIWESHPENGIDVSIVAVKGGLPPGVVPIRRIGSDDLTTTVRTTKSSGRSPRALAILGFQQYPASFTLSITQHLPGEQDRVLEHFGNLGHVPLVYTYVTSGGASGSPIFDANSASLVGLHQRFLSDRKGKVGLGIQFRIIREAVEHVPFDSAPDQAVDRS